MPTASPSPTALSDFIIVMAYVREPEAGPDSGTPRVPCMWWELRALVTSQNGGVRSLS